MAHNAANDSDSESLPSYHTYPPKAHKAPAPAAPAEALADQQPQIEPFEIEDAAPQPQQKVLSNGRLITQFVLGLLIFAEFLVPLILHRTWYPHHPKLTSDEVLPTILRHSTVGAMTFGAATVCSWYIREKSREHGLGEWAWLYCGLWVVGAIPTFAILSAILLI